MKVLRGVVAVSGLAKGVSCLYTEKVEENIPHYGIQKANVEGELIRLGEAYEKAAQSLDSISEAAKAIGSGSNAEEIINVHRMILDDRKLYGKVQELIGERLVNAEHAVSDAFSEYINRLRQKNMHFAELSHDITDVKNRILHSFSGTSGHFECPVGDRQPVVVVSRRLTPSMVLGIPPEHVIAFVTQEGGFTTHATILARGYGVPVIFGVDVEGNIECGENTIVDAKMGKVIVSPDGETEAYYAKKIEETHKRKLTCAVRKTEPPQTVKGKRVELKVNISTPEEMHHVKDLNYDGVGLLRTEFLFLKKKNPPTQQEQVKMYRHLLDEAAGKPVTVRLLDVGTDKLPPYLTLPEQENPDLGIRGPRALEFFYDIYFTQMKAILESSVYGDIRILYPMVSDMTDIKSFREVLSHAKESLKKEKKKFNNNIKEGIMIETPSAALMAEGLLAEVDFANIGSNDLLQYALAASRGNTLVENRYHILHPSLVKLMELAVKAAGKQKKEICLCGEITSFEEFYKLLLGVGLRSFSVTASKLEDIKCHLLYEKNPPKTILSKYYRLKDKKDMDSFFKK
ncbi:MAG: phosphoenolpyruvate--protein phosphotransferase [bacterium]